MAGAYFTRAATRSRCSESDTCGTAIVAGLRPIFGFNAVDAAAGWTEYPDTIDPRQKDQTHTALAALNDEWKLDGNQRGATFGILPHLQPVACSPISGWD